MENPIKRVIRSSQNIFVNSEVLVVEYHDVIRAQWFPILTMMAGENALDKIFHTSIFEGMDNSELFEWYVNRKHRNMFYDIPMKYVVKEDERDVFLESVLNKISHIRELYSFPYILNMENTLRMFLTNSGSVVKHVYVYGGTVKDEYLEEQVSYNFRPKSVEFLYGDFKEQIAPLNKDATYILSDITKVNDLKELNKIPFASILISDGWRYNYTEEDSTKLKVDVDAIRDNYTCRISFFNNLYRTF